MATSGRQAPSAATYFRWRSEFQSGIQPLEDETQFSRPVTALTAQNMEAVRKLIKEEARIIVEQMQNVSFVYIEFTTNDSIPCNCTGVWKLLCQMVSLALTAE